MNWLGFPLHPSIPEGGITLGELFRGRNMDIPAMHARMKGLMSAEGLAFTPTDRVWNTRLAQELSHWAETQGAPQLHHALFLANFVHGQNIGDIETLVSVATAHGLVESDVRRVLETRSQREAVDASWSRARSMGVSGVPTFVVGRRGVVGAQPYQTLEQLIVVSGGVRRQTPDAPGH